MDVYDDVGLLVSRIEGLHTLDHRDVDVSTRTGTAAGSSACDRTAVRKSCSQNQTKRLYCSTTGRSRTLANSSAVRRKIKNLQNYYIYEEEEGEQLRMENGVEEELIELNVSGVIYTVLKSTLAKYKESLLWEIVSASSVLTCPSPCPPAPPTPFSPRYFINGDGQVFRYVLHFLRRGVMPWPVDQNERRILMDDLKYYRLDVYTGDPPAEVDLRLLQVAGTALSKLGAVDNEYQISSTFTKTAMETLKKIKEIDETFKIHETLGSSLVTGANIAIQLDNKYSIHRKLTQAVVDSCVKIYEIDQQYLLHEKLSSALSGTLKTAQTINSKLELDTKIGRSIQSTYNLACHLDNQWKVQEKVSWTVTEGVKYLMS